MTLRTNSAPLLSNIKHCASFHHTCNIGIYTATTVRKRLNWVLTCVALTFDLWPWPFAWTSRLLLVITPKNFMKIWWRKHSEKGVTAGRRDRQTDTNRQTDRLSSEIDFSEIYFTRNLHAHLNWILIYKWSKVFKSCALTDKYCFFFCVTSPL